MEEKEYTLNSKNIISALCAFLTTFVLSLNLDIVSEETISNTIVTSSRLVRFAAVLYYSLNDLGILYFIILVALFLLYRNTFYRMTISKKQKYSAMILAVIFTLFILVGNSYYKTKSLMLLTNNYVQIGKIIIAFFGYLILLYVFVSQIWYGLDTMINKLQTSSLTSGKSMDLTSKILGTGKTSFIRSFIIISIIYLPYIIVAYPSCFMGDTPTQLRQVYGLASYSDGHPICHTLFLGGCLKLGEAVFHSKNSGLFIYTLLQCFIMIFVLSYSIHRIMSSRFSFISLPVLAFYSFVPFFQMYSVVITKDSIWAPMVLLWNIEFLDILGKYKEKVSWKKYISLFVVSILICLFRKNGIYLFVLSVLGLLLVLQKQRKHMLAFLICTIVLFQLFNSICLPGLHVEAGNKREMLSIPFQQTARYVCTYPDEVTTEEKEAIAKVLDYDTLLTKYSPTFADPVKNTFHQDATSADLKAYFLVWFQMLKKHPGTYISATVNNYYDYFYFAKVPLVYRPEWSQSNMEIIKAESSDFQEISHYYGSDFINKLRNFIIVVQDIVCRLPGISFLMTAAIYQWIMFIAMGYLIVKKYYKLLVAYIPMLSILLVNLAGPTNGSYFRYEYPIAFCLPYVVIWSLHQIAVSKTAISGRQ